MSGENKSPEEEVQIHRGSNEEERRRQGIGRRVKGNKGKSRSLPLPPSYFALMNAASPFVYLWGDIINHKNVAARVNVTGVDPSQSGFEPGSLCPCERGDRVQGAQCAATQRVSI